MTNDQGHSSDREADRITITYPATTDDRIRSNLETTSYRRYLRTTKAGTAAIGDEWAEFVSGGCGSTIDVVLRVEAIEGGDRIGEDTKVVFAPRFENDE